VLDKGIEEVGIVSRVFVRSREPIITVLPLRVVLADIRDVVFVVEALRLKVLVVEAVIVVAKRLVKYPVTELIILEIILFAVVVPYRLRLLNPLIDDVAVSPFTIDVRRLVEVEYERVLVFTAVVVEIIPFILLVRVLLDEESVLSLIILVEADMPLTVVVKILLEDVAENELMIEAVVAFVIRPLESIVSIGKLFELP
jgi:hypothetical protein